MFKNDRKVLNLLEENNLEIILLDLGASGAKYKPFSRLKDRAVRILIDADARDFDSEKAEKKTKEIRIDKAIIDSDENTEATIYLTKNPHCSSTLKPNFKRLNSFVYADFFEIEKSCNIPATSINRLARDYNLNTIDWIKLDTQGTELRILKSLNENLLENLLCIDVEICFYDHYEGSDTISKLHDFLVDNNYWISEFKYQSQLKLRKIDLEYIKGHLNGPFRKYALQSLNRIPTAPEIRYFKNIADGAYEFNHYLKLWAISYFTNDYSSCIFLSNKMDELFENKQIEEIKAITKSSISSNYWVWKRMFRLYANKVINKLT